MRTLKFLIFFVAVSLLFAYCTPTSSDKSKIDTVETENEGKTPQETGLNEGKTTDAAGTRAMHFTVKTESGSEIARIMVNGNNIEIKAAETHYKSKLSGVKRKYQSRSGDIIVEVKYKDESFKLRTPTGDLKWKVKLYDDKVKISDNEENINPYQIKEKDTDRAKVYLDDNELGEVEFVAGKLKIKGEGVEYKIASEKMHLAAGVLLCENDMQELDKIILMAELIAKGW